MPPKLIPLSKSGLVDVEDAATRLKAAPRTVQKWIADGLLPVHSVGDGMVYLIREADLAAFVRPKMGRPRLTGKKRPKGMDRTSERLVN